MKYDLPSIKERMRKRLEEMEVGRRHDTDRACDDMVESQGVINKAEPRLAAKHRFYQ